MDMRTGHPFGYRLVISGERVITHARRWIGSTNRAVLKTLEN